MKRALPVAEMIDANQILAALKAPDLMLLDYNLPRGDARTVLQATANNPALARMRKAVVTSSLAPKDREEALRFGADAFVCKPADLDAFIRDIGGAIVELLKRA